MTSIKVVGFHFKIHELGYNLVWKSFENQVWEER